MKVVINKCFGGFGLSDAAYEKLIEWGIPVRKYREEQRNPDTGLYEKIDENEGRVIFDRELTPPGESRFNDHYHEFKGRSRMSQRYWETWIRYEARSDPLIVRVVEELGDKANGGCSELAVVEIPDGIDYEISEYDGQEHIAEKHRTWS